MNTRAARTEFLRKGGYGFFYHFHYREQWLNPEEERLADDYYRICRDWNKVVENFDVEETARVFDLLLGDNLAGRKEHIAEHGAEYLDDLDVS